MKIWLAVALLGAFCDSCKSLKRGRDLNDDQYSSLASVEDPKGDLVMTAWFRASEASLLSQLKFPINANQATMGGGGRDNVDVDVRFLPSFVANPDRAEINLALAVSAVGSGTASESGVTVSGGVTGYATVIKNLSLGIDGVKSSAAVITKNVQPQRPTIMTSGLLRRLKTRIANNRYWEEIGAHVYEMQAELGQIPPKMDAMIDPQLAMINRQWQEMYYDPFIAKDKSGAKARVFTTDDALHFAVFQPQKNLRIPVKKITSDPWDGSAAVLLMHESQIEYQMNAILAGQSVTVAYLKKTFCKFDVGISLCNKEIEGLEDNQTIKFAAARPITVNFLGQGEGDAKLPTIEFVILAGFDPQIDTLLKIIIRYELDLANRQAVRSKLAVDAHLPEGKDPVAPTRTRVSLPQKISWGSLGNAAWNTATTTVGNAVAVTVDSVFRKALPAVIYIPPVGAALIGELSPREWKIGDHWLRVSWVFTPWQDVACTSVNTKTVYNGFVCNSKSNGVDACWDHRGNDFYGNTNGWIKCGDSWKGKACSELKFSDLYFGKKCRFLDQGKDSCWYYVGPKEPGNTNGWKQCIIPKI
ncbi:MAG: hypothetical protein NTV34_18825 [Proteobacteria bacterium]|nr:hypothetical protein [Pseudomonadota bacterium]